MIFVHQELEKFGALEFHKQGLVQQLFPKPEICRPPLPAAGRGETREYRRNQAP